VVADGLPGVIAAALWARRQAGWSCVDISLWLARLGYLVPPDEVTIIASQYAQQHDAHSRPQQSCNDPRSKWLDSDDAR
jgi:hypothetical protein